MISEKAFAREFSSLWRSLTPTSENFVRSANLAINRVLPPMDDRVAARRRGFVNEVAFELFGLGAPALPVLPRVRRAALSEAVQRTRFKLLPLAMEGSHSLQDPDSEERKDILEQVRRLDFYFGDVAHLQVHPEFSGCGLIDSCEGDVLADNVLYEIKSGGRDLRSIDLRQLLIYATLNFLDIRYDFDSVGIFNPRVGTSIVMELEELSLQMSGLSAIELMGEIAYAMSRGDISR